MGHTNSTANLSLPQFISTDKPTWLGDVNGAFSAIDSYAGTNDAAVAGAVSDASSAIAQAASAVSTATAANTTAGNASTAATNAVGTANNAMSLVNQTNIKIGTLANLTTTDKSSIVNAINEVDGKDAGDITYDNSGSGLTATNVQDAIDEVAQGGGGGGSLTQKLPLMTSNTEAEGTASGNAHGGVTTYYKSIDGSGVASDAIELASADEYLQFTFTTPTHLMYMTYHAVGFSNTRGADITADFSTDGTTWTKGAMQFNPANGIDEIFNQYINDTVKAIRVYNNQGIGSVKIYKIEAFG